MTGLGDILPFSRKRCICRTEISRWWRPLMFALLVISCCTDLAAADEYRNRVSYRAIVNITYRDLHTKRIVSEKDEIGTFGRASKIESESGMVVHVRSRDNKTDGCSPPVNVPGGKVRWIALIRRGDCKFTQKIRNAAVVKNASAVVIYDHQMDDENTLMMDHAVDYVVSIFIGRKDGEHIAHLVDNGTKVMMYISVGSQVALENMNKTSVIFVSVSFIVLIIISLGWLVFYYIQRFRYAHAKERLAKRLMNAAKKAISKMPLRTLKQGDKEITLDYQCAVCIEGYKHSEVVRILPCMHFFHKTCVDPWLVEQRSCPMCKLDILKAIGVQVRGASHENIANIEPEGVAMAMLTPENTASSSDVICQEDRAPPLSQSAQVVHHHHPEPWSDGSVPLAPSAACSPSSPVLEAPQIVTAEAPENSCDETIQSTEHTETESLMSHTGRE